MTRIDEYVGGTDILGGYDIDGYDVGGTDIIGAMQPPHPAVVRAQQHKAAQHMAALRSMGYPAPSHQMPGLRGGEHVAVASPDIARRQIAPLGPAQPFTFAAATVQAITFSFRPQRPFRIERLVLSATSNGADVTSLLTVTDFLVGAEPQFVNAGVCPGSMFAATAFGASLRGNTAEPGIDVTLLLSLNAGIGTYLVSGAIVGTSLT